uniref:Uncharacterized protein n=1 Tax=Tremella fuciformis TaxID=64657 RepID=D5KY01_9TREE|nr:unknown [Tremella fuciformis]
MGEIIPPCGNPRSVSILLPPSIAPAVRIDRNTSRFIGTFASSQRRCRYGRAPPHPRCSAACNSH